jgi:hypothetical protein
MTRQIALGAIIAFGVTVLALSVWEPKPVIAPTPPPTAPAVEAPKFQKPFRPLSLRPDAVNQMIRPQMVLPAQAVDAGAPGP